VTKTITNRLRRFAFTLLCGGATAVFFSVVAHHVYTTDFRPLAGFCLPFLVVFFGFTSLLYMRGRSLGKGRDSVRTLFAAERSMQATVFYLSGVVLGASLYGLLQYFNFVFDPQAPTLSGLWLLLFAAPYLLMQRGLLLYLTAIWIIVPQLLHPVSPYQVWRRVAREP